jgi:VanZ family protein
MKEMLGSAVVFVLVTLEEVSQLFFKSRTFSLLDLSFDYAGILCGGRLSSMMSRRRRSTIMPGR